MTVVTVKPRRAKRNPNFSSFDRLFNDFFSQEFPAARSVKANTKTRPATNIIELEDAFRIDLAIPGLNKDDFKLHVEKEVLSIEAKKEGELKEGERFHRREFGAVEFKHSFKLPESVHAAAIDAAYLNGILSITLPKKEEAKEQPARQINIA